MERCDQAIAFGEADRQVRCTLVADHDGAHQAIVQGVDPDEGRAVAAVILWPLPDPDDERE